MNNKFQRIYNTDNSKLLTISPYVDIYSMQDGYIFFRRDLCKKVVLQYQDKSVLTELLKLFIEGISEEELIEMIRTKLQEPEPLSWISLCIRMGVIE